MHCFLQRIRTELAEQLNYFYENLPDLRSGYSIQLVVINKCLSNKTDTKNKVNDTKMEIQTKAKLKQSKENIV